MTKQHERYQALAIRATLGIRKAAAYLRNRGWAVEGAVAFLCRV